MYSKTVGDITWWYDDDGDIHRDGAPAVITPTQENWFRHGLLHREDGPAIIISNGIRKWCINGDLHREDGPAIEMHDGETVWYWRGKIHREDGPAMIDRHGNKIWYHYGTVHRLDGPAYEWNTGKTDWVVNGHACSTAVKKWLRRNKFAVPLCPEAQTLFALTFISKYGVPTK